MFENETLEIEKSAGQVYRVYLPVACKTTCETEGYAKGLGG